MKKQLDTLAESAVTSDKIALTTSIDANGWTVYNFGGFMRYSKVFTGSMSVPAATGILLAGGLPLPVGLTSMGARMLFSGTTADAGGFPWISYNIGYAGGGATTFGIGCHNSYAGGAIPNAYSVTVVIEV